MPGVKCWSQGTNKLPAGPGAGNDVTAPVAIAEFKKLGIDKVYDQSRVVLVPDHFTPNKDIKSAEQCKILRILPASMR